MPERAQVHARGRHRAVGAHQGLRQETVDPLKGVGRYLGYGAAGALLGGVGVILLMLAGLRALQTETGGALDGNLSWLPYLIVLAVAAALVAWAVTRISRK